MHKRTSTAIPEIIPLKRWVIWWVSDKADIPAVPAICLVCVGYLGHPHTSLCCVRERAESIFNAGNVSQWQTTNKSVNKRDILMRAKLEKPSKYILHHPVCQTHHDLSCIQWMPYLLFIYLWIWPIWYCWISHPTSLTDLQKVCFTLNFPLCGTDLLNRANYHYSAIP